MLHEQIHMLHEHDHVCCKTKPRVSYSARHPRLQSSNTGHWRHYPQAPKFRVTCWNSRSNIFSSQAPSADRFVDYQDTVQYRTLFQNHTNTRTAMNTTTLLSTYPNQFTEITSNPEGNFYATSVKNRYQDKFCSCDDHTCIAICSSENLHTCLAICSSGNHLAYIK